MCVKRACAGEGVERVPLFTELTNSGLDMDYIKRD